MRIREVEWPEGIQSKVEVRHALTIEQVESALMDRRAFIRRVGRDRYFVFGQSEDGAYVSTVFFYQRGVARVISARTMTQRERQAYQRRGK